MTRINLPTKRFQKILTTIIKDINAVQGQGEYKVTFNEGTAYVEQRGSTFFMNYMEKFMGLTLIYSISTWMNIRDNKPVLVIVNEKY